MKTKIQIQNQISFLKNDIKNKKLTESEKLARLDQIYVLEWVLKED